MTTQDTIVALATPSGSGAIGIIRLSGPEAINISEQVFTAKSKIPLSTLDSHTVHLGDLSDGERLIDEALVTLFKGQRSYTGEPSVEFSCHGSHFILTEVIQLLINKGCRIANAGEFTMRAFLNGKMDLSQAEAVADLIASDNAASHQLAMQQMRGGFTNQLKALRQELLDFASLIELELDFSEEDVEFANREQFKDLVTKIEKTLKRLIDSFAVGNVLKKGIPVAIVGEPNVGKSTLLNAFLNEERAIVSDIAGTTRDTIEDEIAINGIGFRFIDTAGIRETQDQIEGLGIQRTFEKIKQSQIVIRLIDSTQLIEVENPQTALQELKDEISELQLKFPDQAFILIANKVDQLSISQQELILTYFPQIKFIAAKQNLGIEQLKQSLVDLVDTGVLHSQDAIVTNARHYGALQAALTEINEVQKGLNEGLTTDLLAIDVRQALYHFGEITGEVTNDELLGNIFANFCIGK